MTGIFVVGLPCGDRRVLAIAFRQRGDNPGAFDPVGAVAEAIVAARSKAARLAIPIQRGGVAVDADQALPSAQRCPAPQLRDPASPNHGGPVRVPSGPSKLPDPDPCHAQIGHARGIFGPLGFGPVFGPVFGVVADAKAAFHKIT
jgi:hypothetical protein